MKKLSALLIATSFIFTSYSYADGLSFEVGASAWQTKDKISTPTQTLKTKSDFGKSLYAFFEHPVPYVPNVRLEYLDNSNDAKGSGKEAQSNFSDLTLYYDFENAGIHLDLGLSARKADFEIDSGATSSKADTVYSTFYAKILLGLPLSGLSWGIQGWHDLGLNGGQHAQDYDFFIRYKTTIGFGVAVGYRLQKYEIQYDGSNSNSKQKLDGAYVSLLWHF